MVSEKLSGNKRWTEIYLKYFLGHRGREKRDGTISLVDGGTEEI
jgi:hypothetical protein